VFYIPAGNVIVKFAADCYIVTAEVKIMKRSLKKARRCAINAQLLDARINKSSAKEAVAQTIEKLGYIQIDTIAVIQRAHHHTLWTRLPRYSENSLHELQSIDRRIFEYWGHAASCLPMTDYRFYLPRMRRFADPHSKWEKQRLEKYGHLMEPVLERIKNEGPLGSRDFVPPNDRKKGTWWDWRPTKVALELLFWQGKLMITERRNFQRIYDLTERVLPPGTDTTMPDDRELGRFLVRRALGACGIAQEKEIREHIHAAEKSIVADALEEMLDSGEITAVTINEKPDKSYYMLTNMIDKTPRSTASKLHLLSPFDNFIIQRERIKTLFDFDYSLECYVPAGKRKHGYFVLPIFCGDKFAGRLDPKADRKNKTLIIRQLKFEPDYKISDKFLELLGRKLCDFAEFNGCENIELEKVDRPKIRTALKRIISKWL